MSHESTHCLSTGLLVMVATAGRVLVSMTTIGRAVAMLVVVCMVVRLIRQDLGGQGVEKACFAPICGLSLGAAHQLAVGLQSQFVDAFSHT
jgi:hypothetical protein